VEERAEREVIYFTGIAQLLYFVCVQICLLHFYKTHTHIPFLQEVVVRVELKEKGGNRKTWYTSYI
jgi:hypothetical protein